MSKQLAALIRSYRERARLSQQELATRIGVSRQAVQQWESGETGPKRSIVPRLASVLGISASVIDPMTFANTVRVDDNQDTNTIVLVNLHDIPYGGQGGTDVPVSFVSFALGSLIVASKLSHCVAVRVTDDSMAPEYTDGDVCIVDCKLPPEDGDDVVVSFQEQATVLRRYVRRGRDASGFTVFDLVTPNVGFPTVTVSRDVPAKVVGVVVEHRRQRRRMK